MYGLWILATAFALLTAGAVVLATRFNKKQKEGLLTDSKTIKGFAWQTATAGMLAAVFGLSFVITGLFAVVKPIQADKQYREFEAKRAVVSQLVTSGIESEYAIAQSMVSANDWYAHAKADKEKFGIFSMYYKLDFDWIMPVSKGDSVTSDEGFVYFAYISSIDDEIDNDYIRAYQFDTLSEATEWIASISPYYVNGVWWRIYKGQRTLSGTISSDNEAY